MTRAKDSLTLGLPLRSWVTPQTRNGDRHLYTIRISFIPGPILDKFESINWAPTVRQAITRPAPRPSMSQPGCGRCGEEWIMQ